MKRGRPFFKGIWPYVLLAALIGVVELPFASFMADDFILLGALEGVSSCAGPPPLRLYEIADGDPARIRALKNTGAFPWFFAPDFRMAFFRPLSSALLALDHHVFGLRPLGYRAHGVAWFLLLVVGVGLLLRRVLPVPAAVLALFIFVMSGVHGTLCWTAARHIVVAAAFGIGALHLHVHRRLDGRPWGGVPSLVALVLSLAAGEAGVATSAYILAFEAFAHDDARRQRLRACLPPGLILLIYLLFYRLAGYGASASSGYINPLAEPLRFLTQLPGRLFFLLGAMIAGGNADLWVLRPQWRLLMTAAGALLCVLFALVLRAAWKGLDADARRGGRWLLAGAVLSAVPFIGTPIGSRCLVVPLVGGAATLALLLRSWRDYLSRMPGPGIRLAGGACALLALIHLALAPTQRLAAPFLLQRLMSTRLAAAMAAPVLARERIRDKTMVILAAPDMVIGLHSYFFRILYRLPMPVAWRVLAWAPCAYRFQRLDDRTLAMDAVGGEISSLALQVGDVIRLRDLQVRVTGRSETGITGAEFRFSLPLDDPALLLLAWEKGRLRRMSPPPPGGTLFIQAPRFEM
jgi:hypothetical protein